MKRNGRQRLDSFVEEWWALHGQPNLERSTLAVYRWAWEHHARPQLGRLRLREVTPLTIARFRTALEATGAGAETVRKTLTMLQSVFQRAVEWQLLATNPVCAARKPPLGRARAVPAIGPGIVEVMRADLLARGRDADARLIVLLAYAGLRPGEAPASSGATSASARSSSSRRSRTARPRCSRTGAHGRSGCSLPFGTTSSGTHLRPGCGPLRRRPVARDGLAQLAAPGLPTGRRASRPGASPALRPPPRLRLAPDRRGPARDRRDRRPARPQPDRLPGRLRARAGGAGGRGSLSRGTDLGGESGGGLATQPAMTA